MKWIGVTGSWRAINPQVKEDIRIEVTNVLKEGNGIVTGGALNVDYEATALSLKYFPSGSHIRVILPTTLEIYANHYRKRAKEGIITRKQAEDLISQLELVKKLGRLDVMNYKTVDLRTYFYRNTKVVETSDELLAFQVNKSRGVQDTVNKALERNVPVKKFEYVIEESK
ncbi:MAG TPA: hypothetical protein VFB03_03475 [Candidatus Saccharimonadales bacterium]|nr:hypothetical protein [Candidatus Saccharimonadales bacterium]